MHSEPRQDPGPIDRVAAGMRVVDAAGENVGRVRTVALGDPNAVTAQDPPDGAGVLGNRIPHTEHGDEPEVPPDVAARLLRTGYLRIDIWHRSDELRVPTDEPRVPTDEPHVPTDDLYVAADQIAVVTADALTLTVTRDRLTTRG